ncbi:MAG: hypothetical protein AAFX93_14110 [Verrucomicrobiota bacterium]
MSTDNQETPETIEAPAEQNQEVDLSAEREDILRDLRGEAPEAIEESEPLDDQVEAQANQPKEESDTPAPEKQEPATTDKAPSKYEQAQQKEQERKDRSWRKLNEQKEKLEEEREAFARERSEWEQGRQQNQRQQNSSELTPDDFRQAAVQWRRDAEEAEKTGDLDKAAALRSQAEAAEQHASKITSMPAQDEQNTRESFESQYRAQLKQQQIDGWQVQVQKYPELRQKGSELNSAVVGIYKQHPGLNQTPDGPAVVMELIELRKTGARVSDLEADKNKLTQRVAELEAALSPGGGGAPPGPSDPKPFDSLSMEGQRASILNDIDR